MKTYMIDKEKLYSFFVSGTRHLIASEHCLNSINVFPVVEDDPNFTMSSIAKGALENVSGKSGMTFAQYLKENV